MGHIMAGDWCYYPHRLRDSVSPVCGIFSDEIYVSSQQVSTAEKAMGSHDFWKGTLPKLSMIIDGQSKLKVLESLRIFH